MLLPSLNGIMEETDGSKEGLAHDPSSHRFLQKKLSKPRKKGILRTEPRNVTVSACEEAMLGKVLPAIKSKWLAVAKN